MSGLLFKADCVAVNSVCKDGDDGRTCQRDRRSLESWTPVHTALTNTVNWRRKQRTKTSAKLCLLPMPARSTTPEATKCNRSGICCPTQFFREEFVQKIEANRAHQNQRWIFNLIQNPQETTEKVFLNKDEWMLVKGSSFTSMDERYLVIFKDMELRTIRDLRQKHVPMLQDVEKQVNKYLLENCTSRDFRMYFHYLPSVFQLHMHVCNNSTNESIRRQYLNCVVANIEQKDTWYRDALILFAPPRGPRAQGVCVVGNEYVSEDTTPDKQDGVDI